MDQFEGRLKQKQFITKKYIGQGNFGKVQKCIRKIDDKLVAVKIIDMNIDIQLIRQQAQLMKKIKSDYTLELLDHFYDQKLAAYILVLPFYRKGNLSTIMHRVWDSKDILLFLYQIQRAFIEIYKNNIWHLDLKPDNILIKGQGQYLVCDFGCAKLVDNSKVSNVLRLSMSKGGGTTDYASPQLILKSSASKYSDMWSLGILLYEIIYKKHPLQQKTKGYTTVLEQFLHGKIEIGYPQKEGYESIIQLAKKMLTGSNLKCKRLTWQQLGSQIISLLNLKKYEGRVSVITDINELINYGANLNTVLSGLIYYLEINRQFLLQKEIKIQALIAQTKLYMNCHIEIIQKAIKQNNQLEHYYIFPTTLRSYTDAKSLKVSHIIKRTQNFTNELDEGQKRQKEVVIRQNFKSKCEEFLNKIAYLENQKPQNQWFKVKETLKGILKGTNYQNKDNIKKIAQRLVYN